MSDIHIESSWKNALSAEFDKAYFFDLIEKDLKREKKRRKRETTTSS